MQRTMMKRWGMLAMMCLGGAVIQARAGVRLNSLFTDNMVLQRDRPIRVWGLADPGEVVKVSLAPSTGSGQADSTLSAGSGQAGSPLAGQQASVTTGKDGRWSVELPGLKEGEGLELVVTGKNTVTLKNIIMGDVWVCGGQSNMNMPMNFHGTPEAKADIQSADFPKIRRVKISGTALSYFPEEHTPVQTAWQMCSTQTVSAFTAAGFYFAREVFGKTGVPIGLLDVNRGGTIAEEWMPFDASTEQGADKMVAFYSTQLDLMAKWLATARQALKDGRLPDSDGVKDPPAPSVSVKSLEAWERWVPMAQAALANRQYINEKGERLAFRPDKLVVVYDKENTVLKPIDPNSMDPGPAPCWWHSARPSCLYRGLIHPLVRFPIKGVIWYQGESNAFMPNGDPQYPAKHKLLVEGWRKAWGQGDFPFYYVQLPGWPWKEVPNTPVGGDGWTKVREAQFQCRSIPNTGMIVTVDIGDPDLHPPNKYDVGMRLARWALARDYGIKDVAVSGPIYRGMKVEGDPSTGSGPGKIRLSFDYAESGLMVGSKKGRAPVVEDREGKLKWFAIAGASPSTPAGSAAASPTNAAASNRWVWADAVIDGKTVVVSSPEVKAPVAVRYAYIQNPDGANLYNRDGLPASPFRTDDW